MSEELADLAWQIERESVDLIVTKRSDYVSVRHRGSRGGAAYPEHKVCTYAEWQTVREDLQPDSDLLGAIDIYREMGKEESEQIEEVRQTIKALRARGVEVEW